MVDQDNGTEQEQPPATPPPRGRLGRWAYALAAWTQRHPRIVRSVQIAVLIAIVLLSFFTLASETFRSIFSGYIGSFVINLLSSATIILPAPGAIITCSFAAPGVGLDVWLLSLTAAVGSTLGEMIAYLVGYTGSNMLGGSKPDSRVERLRPKFQKYGGPLLLALAFLPIPLFDLAGVLAGALRMNVYRFLAWVFVGKLLKFIAIVWVCRLGIPWLEFLLVEGLFDWLRMLVGF